MSASKVLGLDLATKTGWAITQSGPKERFEGQGDRQGAMVGPRLNYRENSNGGGR